MKNKQKSELRDIILNKIPPHIKSSHHIAKIHKNYAPQFTYATFRNYWKALRKV